MTRLALPTTVDAGDEIPDDLFATLPAYGPRASSVAPTPHAFETLEIEPVDDIFATLPQLPSVESFAAKLAEIQKAVAMAQAEADTLRSEIHSKAKALRALAGALEATL